MLRRGTRVNHANEATTDADATKVRGGNLHANSNTNTNADTLR